MSKNSWRTYCNKSLICRYTWLQHYKNHYINQNTGSWCGAIWDDMTSKMQNITVRVSEVSNHALYTCTFFSKPYGNWSFLDHIGRQPLTVLHLKRYEKTHQYKVHLQIFNIYKSNICLQLPTTSHKMILKLKKDFPQKRLSARYILIKHSEIIIVREI